MGFKFINLFRKRATELTDQIQKTQYYDRTEIDKTGAQWRLIVGTRSNGKTYSVCHTIVEDYLKYGKRGVYIRRYAEQITPKNIQSLFNPHLELIESLSGGAYNWIFYRANCFYLCYMDEDGKIIEKDETPFCITRSVNTWETTKGADVGEISTIVYDEFLTREAYLRDEFVCLMNLISSIIRDRKDCIIYLLANSVNKYAPYWDEFGITEVDKMKKGEIRVYTYPNSKMKLAIEYCAAPTATKEVNDNFFAFQNAQLEMLKSGSWEMAQYQRAPYKFLDSDVFRRFYVYFGGQMICGKIVKPRHLSNHKNDLFIFFCRQTKNIEIDDRTPFYTTDFSTSICHVRFLKDQPTELHKLITQLILKNHMCFSDNDVGEIIRNWLKDQGINNVL